METAIKPSKISRVDVRYRHLAEDVSPRKEVVREEGPKSGLKEEEAIADIEAVSLLIEEQRRLAAMGRAHRMFHRRQEEPKKVKTVVVEVFASGDANGVVAAQETKTPAADAPAIPSVPLPAVPAVPPFPTDLVVPPVPAYPWPSGVSSAPTPDLTSVASPLSTPAPTPTPLPSLTDSLLTSLGFNSTTSCEYGKAAP